MGVSFPSESAQYRFEDAISGDEMFAQLVLAQIIQLGPL
jgi:hypothetical protein